MSSASAVRRLRSALGTPTHLQAVLDVLRDGHVREQRIFLEYRVDVAAPGRQGRDVHAAEFDHAGGGLLESGDHAQHRGLSRPRGTEDREQLAVATARSAPSTATILLPNSFRTPTSSTCGSPTAAVTFTADCEPIVSEGMANRMNSCGWPQFIADFAVRVFARLPLPDCRFRARHAE